MNGDLFADQPSMLPLSGTQQAMLLTGYALAAAPALLAEIARLTAKAPFRQMQTPGGLTMSVAMSNCGTLGWLSDRHGYRYGSLDPLSGQPWPAMPEQFAELAGRAAEQAGFPGFAPDACLINRYPVGARLSLHQDKDEQDFSQPIVSVSLGLPATFQFGGLRRTDPVSRIALQHGDVVVWGGPDRLRHHGILALKPGSHPLTGAYRFNLTFRKAG